MTSEQGNTNTSLATAMRVRVYPSQGQANKLASWLSIAQSFRNAAVEQISHRRKLRGVWFSQNKGKTKEEIKQLLPQDLSGSDSTAVSLWLTTQLEKARVFASREFYLDCGKRQLGEALFAAWSCLSRGEKSEVRSRCEDLGIKLDWLLLPRTILDQVVRDLDKTISKAIKDRAQAKPKLQVGKKKKRKRLAGFPAFRKYRFSSGLRLQVVAEKNASFRQAWAAGEVVLPGLGRLRMRESGYNWPATPPKLLTLSRNAAGQWHVSCICLVGELKNSRSRKLESQTVLTSWKALPKNADGSLAIEGLDMSLPDFAVSNQHGAYGRSRYYRHYQNQKSSASKAVSSKQKGSGRWKKAVRKLGRLEVKIANTRDAGLRKAANEVADRSAIVCLETLYLAGMAKTNLARSLYDLGWGKFVLLLEQATLARGHLLIKAGAFKPTTQACSTSGCDYINRSLRKNLKTRKWECPTCGAKHCRDTNAAHNIQKEAIGRFLELSGAESALIVQKLHPELQDFLARGGMTPFAAVSSVAESRQASPGFVPEKRELSLSVICGRNAKS